MMDWLILVAICSFGIITMYIYQINKVPNRRIRKNIQHTDIRSVRKENQLRIRI
jgi:hypothetical protein